MEPNRKNEMIRALEAKRNSYAFDGKSVFLFGHCDATQEMADYLFACDIVPEAILDNNTSKQGLTYRGIPILPPDQIKKYNKGGNIVLIATRYFSAMAAQLGRIGYRDEIVQVLEYDSFSEYSLTDETITRKTARMRRGTKTLEQIRIKYPEHHLIVCPSKALGDVYWAMAFLSAYCKKHNIIKAAIVVIGNSCRQVAELFVNKDVVTLDYAGMDELVQAIIFTQEDNCIIAHHDRPYTDNSIRYLDRRLIAFIDYYRCVVYGLAENTPATVPVNHTEIENRELILKDKSVILSPYAKSIAGLPEEVWGKIADGYVRQGYKVFTNTAEGELPIYGTEPLHVPVSQIIAAANYAGTFIGIRSGLCDVLYTANCRKIVLFSDCFYSTTPHKISEFFALPGWRNIVCRPRAI